MWKTSLRRRRDARVRLKMFLAFMHKFLQIEVAAEVVKRVLVVNRRVLAICTPTSS